ncbi:hypothetical protein L7F22_001509 [Adiantum nelumboides]|nr:hypothetical protein [Adiantum nelumboides]
MLEQGSGIPYDNIPALMPNEEDESPKTRKEAHIRAMMVAINTLAVHTHSLITEQKDEATKEELEKKNEKLQEDNQAALEQISKLEYEVQHLLHQIQEQKAITKKQGEEHTKKKKKLKEKDKDDNDDDQGGEDHTRGAAQQTGRQQDFEEDTQGKGGDPRKGETSQEKEGPKDKGKNTAREKGWESREHAEQCGHFVDVTPHCTSASIVVGRASTDWWSSLVLGLNPTDEPLRREETSN